MSIGAAAALSVAGCASNSSNEGSGPTGSVSNSVGEQQDLAKLVPADIRSRGKLIIGVNVPYSPNEYLKNGKVVGFDVELLDAVAKVLGLKTDYRQADFEKIVPAVKAGTYDMGMSSFTDSKEREQTDDFVDYFTAGILWASQKGHQIDPNNACGMTISVQATTYEETDELPALSKACTKAGKDAIKILPFANQDDAVNAVILGRAAAFSADSPVTAYAIKQAGDKLQEAGDIREAAPYGWPVKKGSPLVEALQKALQSLNDDGTYGQICTKWGVQSGEIDTVTINGAVS
ncbi:MAG: polar amino acid transport system substrate-binding protein [Pseudonocardiales bacterium]|jgi:polar amino acid transport system substrate-binding protein|nr:polar amino acid transport system substrate-binding protein [Pseudonocardiales bacterium]